MSSPSSNSEPAPQLLVPHHLSSSDLVIDIARSGMKVDKSFKRQEFVEAANVVNNRFSAASMDADNVENHMRTLKQKYQEIKKLMGLSGVGWNETEKMLVLEDETYRTYVEGQPKAKEYLNKPIPYFDELRSVVEDDHATGDHTCTIYNQFGATNLEDNNPPTPTALMDCEPINTSAQRQEVPRSSTSSTNVRTSRSRLNNENVAQSTIADKLGELATSISNNKKTWKEKLSDTLWSMEGYNDEDMDMVFERLRINKSLAESFYMRKPSLRKLWLDKFIDAMKDSNM